MRVGQMRASGCLSFSCSRHLFDQLARPDAFTWASALRSSCLRRRFKEALRLYIRMLSSPLSPTTFAISSALKACARIGAKCSGAAIHAQVHKLGHEDDVYVKTALVDLYSKLGDMVTARRVFDEMGVRNVVSWNSILSGYLKAGDLVLAGKVFDEMPEKDVVSWNTMVSTYARVGDMCSAENLFRQMPSKNAASWNGMIAGYVAVGDMKTARELFDEMPERSNVSWIEMISGYSKYGFVHSACELFDRVDGKDLAVWNAMIACYAQNSRPREALQLFHKMQKVGGVDGPDGMTFSSVISACSQLGDMRYGAWVESHMREVGIEMDDHLRTALIDLCAKCGNMEKAFFLFHGLNKRDLISYSAMIMGCGINGKPFDAIRLFQEMVAAKISPNKITFTGLLTAYNHAGLLEEGLQCFESMTSPHHVPPSADHYAIMVDLLGRAGRLEEALALIRSMPMPAHAGIWGALLLACQIHGSVELGELAAQHCVELEPESEASGYYVLLANIYSSVGRWDDAKKLRRMVDHKGLNKVPGSSWVHAT